MGPQRIDWPHVPWCSCVLALSTCGWWRSVGIAPLGFALQSCRVLQYGMAPSEIAADENRLRKARLLCDASVVLKRQVALELKAESTGLCHHRNPSMRGCHCASSAHPHLIITSIIHRPRWKAELRRALRGALSDHHKRRDLMTCLLEGPLHFPFREMR